MRTADIQRAGELALDGYLEMLADYDENDYNGRIDSVKAGYARARFRDICELLGVQMSSDGEGEE